MKKVFPLFLITILSFSFFACGSSPKAEDKTPQSEIIEEVPEESIPEPSVEENNSIAEETEIEELTDIVEPEVIDIVDSTENEDQENQNENIEEDSSELINPDELDELSDEDLTLDSPSEDIDETDEDEVISENLEESENSETEIKTETDEVYLIEDSENPDNTNIIDDFEDILIELQDSSDDSLISTETENAEEADSIDVIDGIDENTEEIEEESEDNPVISPSRSVELKKGEYLDVIYPGSGWVYVGLIDGSKDITYNGRRLGTTNTTFTLIAKKEGTFVVHFYKNDTLTGDYIDDYLEITVSGEKTTSKIHKIAPDYTVSVPPKPRSKEEIKAKKDLEKESVKEKETEGASFTNESETINSLITSDENSDSSKKDSDIQENQKEAKNIERKIAEKPNASFNSNTNPKRQTPKKPVENIQSEDDDIEVLDKGKPDFSGYNNVDLESLLQQAYSAYNEKSFTDALKYISDYINMATKKIDEAYFLKGQIYEAQSGIQNINNAVKAYETVINNYPASKFWDKANKRIIYLKRFYLEVR